MKLKDPMWTTKMKKHVECDTQQSNKKMYIRSLLPLSDIEQMMSVWYYNDKTVGKSQDL